MSTDQDKENKSSKRDHGPQGTQVFSRGEVDQLIEQAESGDDASAAAHLLGVSDGIRDQRFALRGDRVVLGRAPGCDVVISDASVSSEHARLSREGGKWRVANLLSTNGTFINNNKVSNAGIADGDRLRLGRVEFILHDQNANPRKAESGSSMNWLLWAGVAAAVGVIAWIVLG